MLFANLHLPVRILFRRELRGGKAVLLLTTLVIAMATAALTLVLSLAHSFDTTYVKQAQTLIGGDYSLRLSQREFNVAEREWLAANSARFSEIRVARVLAVTAGQSQLIRLKAIDENYPLYGTLDLQQSMPSQVLLSVTDNQAHPVFIDETLVDLLGLSVGDTFTAGGLTLRVANIIVSEPDPDLRIWAGAPLVLINKAVLESEAFMRPGTLVSRYIRITLPASEDSTIWRKRLDNAFPDAGWRIQTPDDARSSAQRTVDKVRAFLSLVALAAILLAGIGCGNALSAFLRARLRAIAVIKLSGGRARLVQWLYLSIVALFAVAGALIGSLLGAVALFITVPLLSPYLPVSLHAEWSSLIILQSIFTVLLLTAAFAIPPVFRFARTNPLVLFAVGGDEDHTPRPSAQERRIMLIILLIAVAALPVSWLEKVMFIGIFLVAALLYGMTLLLIPVIEGLARKGKITWRLGLLAVSRHRRRSAIAVMSFGVGIFVLTAVINTESNFASRIDSILKRQAPSIYLIGIQKGQVGTVDELVRTAAGRLRTMPFIRGRISAIGGKTAETIVAETETGEKWILRGDRGLTWTDGSYIGGSRVSQGKLWDAAVSGLQASFDEEAALAFGIGIGDTLELNILGEPVSAVITSLRRIDWQSLDINFVILLSAAPFANVPHTYMGAVYLPEENTPALQLAIGRQLPNVTPIATAPIFNAARNLLTHTAILLQAVTFVLLLAGLPMIWATLIENRHRRLQDATTLRLLGASRRTIVLAGLTEFSILAGLVILPAMLLGTIAGGILTQTIFSLDWHPQWYVSLTIGFTGLLLFLFIGAGDIARAAKQPPFNLMRNE